ncbi:MAG: XRE family transcriptional regulator [Microcella sp.]|uniref:helix-turn-helix domain-containing protein n=1 Tax=Microcella sp. TaxID=1913979 RepID=UPI0027289A16|nr:XRE family transcriptional regulator [Microcella sp.]MDO8338369.1 XRE family transcriptional regulator [Microcella sp.]
MEDEISGLAVAIGARVRHERQARQWTLDQLADAAGVSRRLLVTVEQGAANPSLGTLLKLSEALGVGLPVLVEPPTRAAATVTQAGSGAVLWSGDHGGRGVLVASATLPDAFELWEWTLEAGERHDSEAHTPGTRELLHVLEGALSVTVDGVAHELTAGDAVAFAGDVAHAYAASGSDRSRFSLAVYEPAGGGARPGAHATASGS